MPAINVRIMKNGKIQVETEGMEGKECVPYAFAICKALHAVPLNCPGSPQPVFDFDPKSPLKETALDMDTADNEESVNRNLDGYVEYGDESEENGIRFQHLWL